MVGSQYPDKKEPLDFRRFFSFIYIVSFPRKMYDTLVGTAAERKVRVT